MKYREFCRELRIRDLKTGSLVPFTQNGVQHRLAQAVADQAKAGKPIRLLILKARRMGVSTVIQSRLFHAATMNPDFAALTGAHLDEASSYLHGMAETMWENLPAEMRQPKKAGLRGKVLEFTNRSSLRTFTAEAGGSVGRAQAARALHASEVAFWRDPDATMTALLQIIPNEPRTVVIEESTANGVGNRFHQDWQRATAGDSDFVPVFYPWYEFEAYRMKPLATTLDEREDELAAAGVSTEQLAWRRWAIDNLCGGDPRVFDQEYPDTPERAFLTTGRPFFVDLEALRPSDPIRRGSLSGDPVRGGSIAFSDDADGPLRVYQVPNREHRYVVFGDVAGLASSREYDPRRVGDREDYSAACVVDLANGAQVAEYHCRQDGDEYGYALAQLGRLYMDAWVAVENTGGWGNAPLLTLQKRLNYNKIYGDVNPEDRAGDDEAGDGRLGWRTDATSRPLMLDALKQVVRDKPQAIRSAGLVGEMRTFIVNPAGKPIAAPGCHDDRVMAAAGAYALYQRLATTKLNLTSEPRPRRRVVHAKTLRERAVRV